MSDGYFFTSLTRISDLAEAGFETRKLPPEGWGMGDYVVGEITGEEHGHPIELGTGRMIEPVDGDLVVGAFGTRHATLEATGDWREIQPDGEMNLLTGGGMMGRCTSLSSVLSPLPRLRYRGHATRRGAKLSMESFVDEVEERPFDTPTVLIIGTSMSSGKTTAARVIIRRLKAAGRRVAGCKLTGAGRYRDILTMRDAGADAIFDFVDVGLPSTICDRSRFERAASGLLSRVAASGVEIVVVEAGASPLEPYNGKAAVEALGDAVRFTVLCASDPYAVVGVIEAFGRRPDIATGITSNTRAGIELVERLAEVRTLNLLDRRALPELDGMLEATLGPVLT